jgi:localization factor PodJL
MGALAGRLYDIEERQRSSVNELRHRMDAVEKVAGPGVGSDLLAQVGRGWMRQATPPALRNLQASFAGLDQRLRPSPAERGRPPPVEKLAETLSRQVEGNRVEMMRRLDTAESEGRMDRIERAVLAIGDQVKTSEERSAKAVETMGREVLRIAQNLNGRVQSIEAETPVRFEQLNRKVETDMGRFAQGVEQRLTATDDRHALALEKLGGEITRISDRLSERIAQSERRSQQALDDIGRRLADSSARIEQGYDRASGEPGRAHADVGRAHRRPDRRGARQHRPLVRRRSPRCPPPATRLTGAPPSRTPPGAPFSETAFDDPVYAEQRHGPPTSPARSRARRLSPEPAADEV